mmetsp:Transcript_4641/g.12917  ORF Transcript_4641/g.12917 Transcript_4641/m.12917 type:complete len:178 (+) Transcript_4641:86-619(+)
MAAAEPSSSSSSRQIVRLKSADGDTQFAHLADLAACSPFLEELVQECGVGEVVPVKPLRSRELSRVVAFCRRRQEWQVDHAAAGPDRASQMNAEKGFRAWEGDFLGGMDQAQLYDLLMAANYLHVEPLIDACLERVAKMVKGRTPEEVRRLLGIQGDALSQDQMEEILQGNRAMFSQ